MSPPMSSTNWGSRMLEIYKSKKPPVTGTVDFDKLEQKAREVLKDHRDAFLYVFGSAGSSSTYRVNRKAFDSFRIVPRMLRDVDQRDLSVTIFGVKHPCPLFIAPVGVQGIWHADGELATARAAKNLGVPFILSTASSRSIEEVARENGDSQRWYQLYWPRSDDITLSLLKRARENGFTALVVTLDTMVVGWRPHDLDTAYLPFGDGFGTQVGTSDPVFMARYNMQPAKDEHTTFPYDPAVQENLRAAGDKRAIRDAFMGGEWMREMSSGKFRSWDDLRLLRENWKGPLLLKGIQSVQDAERALDAGIDGIIVSNHGGRQVDGAVASLFALEQICRSPRLREAQQTRRLTVLFDSGIRTGSDIMKALSLGAQAILLGRPWVYGLAISGQAGVEEIVKCTLADLDITMGLCGYATLDEVIGKGEAIAIKQML